MPTTTTTKTGAFEPVNVPDPLKPIRVPPRRVGSPAPRLAADEQIDGSRDVEIADERAEPPATEATNGAAPVEVKKRPTIAISTTVQHRGRIFTIQASDIKLDAFCDLLDEAGYAAPEQPQQWQTLPDGTPICPKHHAPMRLREKQGDSWYSHNVGTKEQPIYCKGYHGKDSPGYDK